MKYPPYTRDVATIKHEISWLSDRIRERKAWLDNPENQRRKAWQEVLIDTWKMERHLEDLFLELSDAISNNQNP